MPLNEKFNGTQFLEIEKHATPHRARERIPHFGHEVETEVREAAFNGIFTGKAIFKSKPFRIG